MSETSGTSCAMAAIQNNPRLINRLYAGIVLPLVESTTYRGLSGLLALNREREFLPLEENRRLQWEALLHLLDHAYESTPFYRRRFEEAGLRPSDIQSPSDLKKIAPLTRDDLRGHQNDLWSRHYRREDLLAAATGGTTDTPIPLLRSRQALRKKTAAHLQFNTWAGMWPGDDVFYLWGARVDFAQNPSWRWRFYDRYVNRRIWAPASLLNEEVMESFREILNKSRPRIIYAYPTPLALFCEFLREQGKAFHRPASAICTAEPLFEEQRQIIEEVLECPVFEMYGSRESGMIAAECEYHQGLHLNPHSAYLEFLPVAGGEVDGLHEIVVTDLLNDGMPFIRYVINDCALLSNKNCQCGRGYPLIGKIIGRTADMFKLPNGDQVPGVSLHRLIAEDCPGFRKLQIIQETLCDFRVRFVRGESYQKSDLKLLVKRLGQRFGTSLHWEFEPVDDIARERSGKTRFCISHVNRSPTPAAPERKVGVE